MYYDIDFTQKTHWLLQQIGIRKAFNIIRVFELENINFPLFESAVHTIVANNESLRTSFEINEGKVMHKINEFEDIDSIIHHVDLRKEYAGESWFEDYLWQEKMKQFDLKSKSLCKLNIYQIDKVRYRGVFLIDHLVCDGISLLLLEKQLFDHYSKLINGEQTTPYFVDKQLRDYQNWKSRMLLNQWGKIGRYNYLSEFFHHKNKLAKARNVLQEYNASNDLKECIATLNDKDIEILCKTLPTENIPCSKFSLFVNGDFANRMQSFLEKNECNLFSVLLTSISMAIAPLTGSMKNTFAFLVSDRHQEVLKDVVGWINSVGLVSMEADKHLKYIEYLTDTIQLVNQAIEFRHGALMHMLKEINCNQPFNELISAHLNLFFENYDLDLNKVMIKQRIGEWLIYDLDFKLVAYNNGLEIEVSYKNELYDAEAIESMVYNIVDIMVEIMKEPSLEIEHLITAKSQDVSTKKLVYDH